MTKEEVQQIVREMQQEQSYSDMHVPNHSHNGLDSLRINEVNTISNNKLFTTIVGTGDGNPDAITISQGLSNPKRVDVTAIITNGVTRTVTTGSAELGHAYIVSTDGSPLDLTNNPTNIAQLYSSVTNSGIVHAGRDFVSVGYTAADAAIIYFQVSSFTENSVTFSSPLLPVGWTITAFIMIS
jgi:hypothetical protein